jgi:hypothetical protein
MRAPCATPGCLDPGQRPIGSVDDPDAFIVAMGGYYDMEAVVTFFTTGYFQEPGADEWQHRGTECIGRPGFALSNERARA